MARADLPRGTVVQAPAVELPDFARRHSNLADAALGAEVLACSDEFFAAAERMLQPGAPVFVAGKFDEHGKWMDGWESRRRRDGGRDWAIIRLGVAGHVMGFDIDTTHFSGNQPQAVTIEASRSEADPDADTVWTEILPAHALGEDAHHFVELPEASGPWTHLRLNLLPDGGVARLRAHGQPACNWDRLDKEALHEVSSLRLGGRIVAVSDAHFGAPHALLMPGRGVDMGDGWETRRRREPGFDWCVIELGHAVEVRKLEIDTAHFKGNFPDSVSVQAAHVGGATDAAVVTQAMFWPELLASRKMQADHQHFFEAAELAELGPVTHVRVNMLPDGGISRVRVLGELA